MKSFKKSFLFGLIVWVIPFIVAMIIFPLRETERPLFESIMPIVLCLTAIIMANIYFIKEGIYLGVLWFIMCIIIDQTFFSWGPQKMGFIDYVKDIGLTYVIIPVITIGTGWAEEVRFKKFIKWIPSAH